MVTIKYIAEKMGVSPTTVANVIHGKTSKVSKENVERIQQALKDYNYVPKMGLESLTKRRSKIILIVIHTDKRYLRTTVSDPFYSQTIGTLEECIRKAGYYMMLYIDKNLDNIFRTALSWNVSGIIAITFSKLNYSKLCSLVSCPVIGLDTYTLNHDILPDDGYYVILNDIQNGIDVGEYLISCGFRKILVIGDAKVGSSEQRAYGVGQALENHHITPVPNWHTILHNDAAKRNEQLKPLLKLAGKDYAIFCTSDQLAFEVVAYLNENGCRLPDDFSVMGFDNNMYAEFTSPRLTTIFQDISRKGQIAADILFRLLNGENVKKEAVILPVQLVVRNSVKPLITQK